MERSWRDCGEVAEVSPSWLALLIVGLCLSSICFRILSVVYLVWLLNVVEIFNQVVALVCIYIELN